MSAKRPALQLAIIHDGKIAILFSDRGSRIKGTVVLFFRKEGFAQNLGQGRYIISDYLAALLSAKGVRFKRIALPPKDG